MKLTIIKWRDIPTQITVKKSRKEVYKKVLDKKFMEAVDEAAMRAGCAATDEYLNGWLNQTNDIADGDMQQIAEQKARELEQAIDDKTLKAMISNKGYKID